MHNWNYRKQNLGWAGDSHTVHFSLNPNGNTKLPGCLYPNLMKLSVVAMQGPGHVADMNMSTTHAQVS